MWFNQLTKQKKIIIETLSLSPLISVYHCSCLHWTFLFPNWFCTSIPTGLYRASLAGYVGFQQNRNIKGELARASVFVFLKGTTALTGFLGWRDVRGGGCGAFSLTWFSFSSLLHILSLFTHSISEGRASKNGAQQLAEGVLDCKRWVPID